MIGERVSRLIAALSSDGFAPEVRSDGISFRGAVKVRNKDVAVRLDYRQDFARLPTVWVEDEDVLRRESFPHLDHEGQLCVVDPRTYLADRYKVAEQARAIVARTALVLEKGLWGTAVTEIADEFARYWSAQEVAVSASPFEGHLALKSEPRPRLARASPKERRVGYAVWTSARLSFRPDEPRPRTFAQFIAWLSSWDEAAAVRLDTGLRGLDPGRNYGMIYAPNGLVGVVTQPSKLLAKVGSPRLWPTLLSGRLGGIQVEPVRGRRIDMEYLLGTNGPAGVAPLAGKHIVLVGCGSIGGHLAFALAQAGAGLSHGSLTLVDPDYISERNTSRHRLGNERVGEGKAKAIRDDLLKALPGISVSPHHSAIAERRHVCASADLVIDATGEQAVGDLLNEWMVEARRTSAVWPGLLHVWIEGNGAAVQTYFSSDRDFGCFRCLSPDLSAPPRYPVLRQGVGTAVSDGCGEVLFNPYGPAAPMAAAALAVQHAVDWSMSKQRKLLRSIPLSYADTQDRKPTNVPKHNKCPACAAQ